MKTVESVYTGGGQVEWFKDLDFRLTMDEVNIVRCGLRIWDCLVVEQPTKVIRTFRSIHGVAISVLELHTL